MYEGGISKNMGGGQTREEVDFHGNTLTQNMLTMNLPFASQVV